MKVTSAIFLGLFLSLAPAYAGPTITMKGSRTLRVDGVIQANALVLAAQIEHLSASDKSPISIIINSPGGSVLAGLQLVEAIHVAQNRGVSINCAVTTLAASMAYVILSECDKRYAFNNSLLLFHPARAFLLMAQLKAGDAKYMGEELAAIDASITRDLHASMGILTEVDRAWFQYHYDHETLWTAGRLVPLVPKQGWLTIISDIQTDGPLFGNPDKDEGGVDKGRAAK